MAFEELQAIADSFDAEKKPAGKPPLTVPEAKKPQSDTQSLLQSIYEDRQKAVIKSPSVPPETAKDITSLSNASGHPPDVVERNLDTYRKRKQELDLQDFISVNPATMAYFEGSPYGKSLAQDDLEGLGILEKGFNAVKKTAGSLAAGLVGTSTSVNAIGEEVSAMLPTQAARFLQDQFHKWRVENENIQKMLRGDQQDLSGTTRAVLSGVESVGQQVIPSTLGIFLQAPELALNVMGAVTAGLSFAQGLDQGLDPYTNFAFGAIQGAIEKYTEYIPMHTLLGSIGTKRGLASLLVRQIASEIPGEQVATAAQDFTEWAFLPENKDKTLADYKAERAPAAWDTLVATVVSTALLGGGGHALGVALGKAEQARKTKQLFDDLGKHAQDSKVRQRAQEEFQKLLSAHTKGTPIETVLIPIDKWNTYWQEQGGNPKEVAAEILGDTKAYDEAVSKGGDLSIPTEVYGNRIAPSSHGEFFNNILKAGPDAMSAEEADALIQSPDLAVPIGETEDTTQVLTPADQQESEDVADAVIQGETLDSLTGAQKATEPTAQPDTPTQEKLPLESGIPSEKGKPPITSTSGKSETIPGEPVTAKPSQVKKQIRISTGMLKAVNLVREDKALNAAFKKAEQNARIAYRQGNLDGVEKERKRMKEIFDTARAKVKTTATLNKLKKQIVKALKTTKVKKQNGRPVGKFTADVQRQLDILREAFKLSPEEARNKINENLEKYQTEFPPSSVVVENRVLDMVARLGETTAAGAGIPIRNKFTVGELQTLLADIKALKENGQEIAMLQKRDEQEEFKDGIETAVDVITGGEGLPAGIETTGIEPKKVPLGKLRDIAKRLLGAHYGWDTILDVLSKKDKGSKPFESRLSQLLNVHDEENAEKRGHLEMFTKIRQMTEEVFGLEGRALMKKLHHDNKPITIGEFTNNNGNRVTLTMSVAEARKLMMEYKDPTLRETITAGKRMALILTKGQLEELRGSNSEFVKSGTLTKTGSKFKLVFNEDSTRRFKSEYKGPNLQSTEISSMGYTDEMLAAVDGILTKQDKEFIDRQLEFYREYYSRINEKYRNHYGVDLPFNEFYSPIRREGFRAPEGLFTDFLEDINARRGVTPTSLRTRTKNTFRLAKQSDVMVLQRHIVEMEHFIAWADKIKLLNAVFKDHGVRAAVALNSNSTMLNVIDDFIGRFTRGGTEFANRLDAVDKIRANMTRSVLAVKPLILTKQLISTAAGAENMPIKHYVAGVIDFWKHPIETYRFFKENSIWFQERANFQERDIKTALSSQEFTQFQRHKGWLDMLMLNVRVGDQAAIIAAGWARYRWQTKVNGMSQEDAIRDFEVNAERVQQSGDLSQLSSVQTRGSITKLFTMFLSSPIQYVNREVSALRNLAAGRQGAASAAKAVAIYHVIIPLLYQFVADGFQWDKEEDLRAVLLGPFNGLIIVGQLFAGLAAAISGAKLRDANIPLISPLSSSLYALNTTLNDIADGDLPIEDVHKIVREFSGLGGALTGLPLKSSFDTVSGVSDGLTGGHFDDAFLSAMGLTPNVIEKRGENR